MPAGEQTPLLSNGDTQNKSFSGKVLSFVKAEGQPGFLTSYRNLFIRRSNILLVFLPLAAVAHYLQMDAGVRFAFSFLAIIPLAKLIGQSTGELPSFYSPICGLHSLKRR